MNFIMGTTLLLCLGKNYTAWREIDRVMVYAHNMSNNSDENVVNCFVRYYTKPSCD